MVLMSIEHYENMEASRNLKDAENAALTSDERFSHSEVFNTLREHIKNKSVKD